MEIACLGSDSVITLGVTCSLYMFKDNKPMNNELNKHNGKLGAGPGDEANNMVCFRQ